MDKVKVVLFILPFGFEILHDELDIWGYQLGWMGLMSFPITWALGNFLPSWVNLGGNKDGR